MFWTLLKLLGAVLLLFVAYVAWVLFRAGKDLGAQPVAEAEVMSDRISVSVSFPGADSGYRITQILLSREVADGLRVSAPDGFSLAPYTLADTGDMEREDARMWVSEANGRDVRWLGSRPLTPDAVTTIEFPIERDVRRAFDLRFQYERRLGLGGQISFFGVQVQPTAALTIEES